MGFEITDDITWADAAVKAHGRDLSELFQVSAEAMMSVMVENPGEIKYSDAREFEIQEESLDFLLFEFLQQFLFYKDSASLLLIPRKIEISEGESFNVFCSAHGEKIDKFRHLMIVDVKAVTMHKLEVVKQGDLWTALFVLDV